MPRDVEVPSEKEIAQLPRWARVAFAARCARRVQPLFVAAWPDASEKNIRVVDQAIELAEKSASRAAYAAADAPAEVDDAIAAVAAARAAAYAAHAAYFGEAAAAARYAAAAARYAADAVYARPSDTAASWFRRDFEAILADVRAKSWDDTTPFPPEVFGPMWPDGPPPSWPQGAMSPTMSEELAPIRGLLLDFHFGPDTNPDDIEESIVRLYEAANHYHMARGKGVLSPDKFRHIIAHAFVPVGGD